MITQNTLLDFFAKAPSVSQEKKLGIGIEKGSNIQFKDTFNSAMDKVRSTDSKKYNFREERNDVTGQRKERFDNYREVQTNTRRHEDVYRNKSIKNRSEKIFEDDNDPVRKNEGKKGVKSNDEIYAEVFANILGMDRNDLNKVLESMNINPEDLTDVTKISDVLNKLSSALGLDDQQKSVLSDIFKMIENHMDSCMGKLFGNSLPLTPGSLHNLSGYAKVPESGDGIESGDILTGAHNNNQPVSDLIATLKSKIEELTLKMIQNPKELSGELAEEIRNIMAQYKAQQLNTGSNEIDADDGELQNKEQMTLNNPKDSELKSDKDVSRDGREAKEQDKKADIRGNETRSTVSAESRQEKQNIFQNTNTKIGEGNNTEINNTLHNSVQKNTGAENTARVAREIPVSKNELFSQIIEKARVVTNGEKSEMVMDLKPESLGKLSLKIVTEHGIVSAKFIAENQQVKEIIETNMQLLKDSLEKQGLSVQGFSVSVGQQSSNGFKRESEFTKGSRNTAGRMESVTAGITGNAIISDNLDRVNPYNSSENRINLTA